MDKSNGIRNQIPLLYRAVCAIEKKKLIPIRSKFHTGSREPSQPEQHPVVQLQPSGSRQPDLRTHGLAFHDQPGAFRNDWGRGQPNGSSANVHPHRHVHLLHEMGAKRRILRGKLAISYFPAGDKMMHSFPQN